MDANSKSGRCEPPFNWNLEKNSSEATHSVLFDTLTLVKEEGAVKISYKLQPFKNTKVMYITSTRQIKTCR